MRDTYSDRFHYKTLNKHTSEFMDLLFVDLKKVISVCFVHILGKIPIECLYFISSKIGSVVSQIAIVYLPEDS